ncbi:MAG: glycosyltransferase family 39 protein, partial [Ignavibacteriaceae bacterium]
MIDIKIAHKKWLIDYVLLILIVIVYGINIYYFTSVYSAPPKWDVAVHLRDSFVFYNILKDPSQISFKVIKDIINKSDLYPLIRPSGYYPPMAPLVTSILYFIFEMSAKTAVMSNIIFLLILVFSIYKIGVLIFDRSTGLVASLLILLFPIILEHSIIYYLDLPLTAFTALAVFVLLKTDFFRNTFILGPLSYMIFKVFNSYYRKSESEFKPFKNIILFIFIVIITFGPYYFPILSQLLKETFKYSHGPLSHGPGYIFSFDSMIFYFTVLWKDMITPYGFILFLSGIIFLLISKNPYQTFLLIWIIIPYLIFTFIIQTKTPRFMMPWLIPVSLLISFSITKISSLKFLNVKLKIEKYVVVLLVLLFFISFLREDFKLRDSVIEASKGNWKLNEIISTLQKDIIRNKSAAQSEKKPIYLGTIPDHYFINGQTIRYYAALKQLPLNVIKLQDYSNSADKKFVQQFDRYDYILTKDKKNIVISSFQKSIDDMDAFFYSRIKNFEKLK